MASLSPLGNPLSREKLAYEQIKAAILNFQLMPGQALVESDLAAQLEISKTPVRDALLRLEKEGLVTRVLYKGASVSEVTPGDMLEIFEIRTALEGMATRLATTLLDEEDIQALKGSIQKQETAIEHKNIDEFSRLNRLFHELIVGKCPNARLKQILGNLEDHMKRYRTLSNYQGTRWESSLREHKQILDAIQRKDADGADAAMRNHLSFVANDLSSRNFSELAQQIHDAMVNQEG